MDDVKSIFVPGSLLRDEMIMNGGAEPEQKPSVDEFAEVPGDMADNGEFAADDAGDDAADDAADDAGDDAVGDDVFADDNAPTGDDALDGGDTLESNAPAQASDEPGFADAALEAAELPGLLPIDDAQADDAADDVDAEEAQAADAQADDEQAPDAQAADAQAADAPQNDILDTPLPPLDELDPVQAGSGWFQGKPVASAPPQAPVADDIAADPLFNMLQSFFGSSSMNNSMADILEEIAYDIHKIKINSASMAKSMELAANAIVKMSDRSSNRNT